MKVVFLLPSKMLLLEQQRRDSYGTQKRFRDRNTENRRRYGSAGREDENPSQKDFASIHAVRQMNELPVHIRPALVCRVDIGDFCFFTLVVRC